MNMKCKRITLGARHEPREAQPRGTVKIAQYLSFFVGKKTLLSVLVKIPDNADIYQPPIIILHPTFPFCPALHC